MGDYDGHASEYQDAKRQPWRTYMEQPSALKLLGKLNGLAVLDLACGESYYSRLLKRCGASTVQGVDLSSDMIALARAQEQSTPLGIHYQVSDVRDLKLPHQFDLVFAAYLFNYARDRQALAAQCKAVRALLKPGGRLVAINNDPDDPPSNFQTGHSYGFTKRIDGPLVEGAEIHYCFNLEGGGVFELTNYFISRETMQAVMEASGLQPVRWHQPTVSEQGVEAMGAEYWRAIAKAPPFCLIEAG